MDRWARLKAQVSRLAHVRFKTKREMYKFAALAFVVAWFVALLLGLGLGAIEGAIEGCLDAQPPASGETS